jgi:hypothetical protein
VNWKQTGVLVVAVAFAAPAAALAGSHALGAGGGVVPLHKDCTRKPMFLTPAGKVWSSARGADGKRFVFQMQNIDQAQIKCVIRRVNVLSTLKGGAPGVPGPRGPAGPTGATGATGPAGAPGVDSSAACWAAAGEVPKDSGIALRNYLDKVQDCIAPEASK